MSGIKVVCMFWHAEQKKMQKTPDWQTHRDLKETGGFVVNWNKYRVFIQNVSIVAAPIYTDPC
jgi:hypothetical protein